jgi:hypothetical protein
LRPKLTDAEATIMAAVKNEGKTPFVKDLLTKNNVADLAAVNEAWTSAGHTGTISASLWQKVRAEMKLTGNLPLGRKPSVAKDGGVPRKAVGRPLKGNGRHEPAHVVRPQATTRDRARVLAKLEADIDEMIFEIKGAGGLPEFEETLRKARRILARSHSE